MKNFKDYVTMNEARIDEIVDYNTMKLPRLRKILGDLQMKIANASTQNKKLQFQNQIGIIKSVIADKEKQEMNEASFIVKESALTFDRVTPLDSKGRKAITYKDSEGRESYPVEFSPKMIDEKKLVEAVRKILG